MNHKRGIYYNENKGKYYESESLSEDEEENSNQDKAVSGKRKSRQRQENSLGELTKNFINYIREQGNKEININEVVRKLKVKKRRIYDITNVLEGIGYIKKLAKNKILWLKEEVAEPKNEEDEEKERLKQEIENLNKEEEYIDGWINNLKSRFENLTDDPEFKEYGYVTFDDIKSLTNGEDINLIAIKAPAGTSLEVPDPDQIHNIYLTTKENMSSGKEVYDQSLLDSLEKKYQLFLDSPNGEINVYLVLSKNEEELNQNQNQVQKNDNLSKNKNPSYNNTVLKQNKSYKNIKSVDGEIINNFS